MSNSIWHTTKESPESVQKCPFCGEELSYAQEIDGGFEILTCDCPYGIWFFGNDKMWNFLDALIAQADKAERLEKENEAMREEFEVWHGNYKCEVEEKKRLQEALEVAKMSLEDCNKILSADMKDWGYLTAEIALKKIEQLTQGETTNDK